jgi:hypothetical protein
MSENSLRSATQPAPLLYLPPLVSRERAEAKLPLPSLVPPFRRQPLSKVELAFLPHFLFRLDLQAGNRTSEVKAAVDGILGHFALWRKEATAPVPAEGEFEFPFVLTEEEARKRLLDQYRWVLISSAIKMRRLFQPRQVALLARFYYPFWVGYFRAGDQWKFEILDGLSGMRQGGKVRDAFMHAWVRRTGARE